MHASLAAAGLLALGACLFGAGRKSRTVEPNEKSNPAEPNRDGKGFTRQISPFVLSNPRTASGMAIEYPKWLLFGDSITQQSFQAGGLGQSLADDYQRRLDIVNRGYGGYNSAWGLHVAPNILPLAGERKPLTAINIWWGANDATLPLRTQSIPLDQFKDNVNKMIDMLRLESSAHYSPNTVIILLSAPPICVPQRTEDVESRFGPGIELDRSAERTKQFAYAMKEVAEQRKVGFVNVYEALMQAAGPNPDEGLRTLLSDGLHLTPKGYQVVYRALQALVQEKYPQLALEGVPRLFPDWSVIDPKDPGASFTHI